MGEERQELEKRRIARAETEKERVDGTVVSVGLCARTAKLVSLSPCTFMSPHVPLCPAMSLDAKLFTRSPLEL